MRKWSQVVQRHHTICKNDHKNRNGNRNNAMHYDYQDYSPTERVASSNRNNFIPAKSRTNKKQESSCSTKETLATLRPPCKFRPSHQPSITQQREKERKRGTREGEMRRRRRGNRTEERLVTRGQGKTRCDDLCFEFARGGNMAGCTQPNQLNHMFVLEIILATSGIV